MFCTFYADTVAADSENGVVAGVFIPVADLPGISDGEFAVNQSAILKEGKAIYGLSNAIYSGLSALSALTGLTITKGNPSGTGVNRFTESFTLVFQWLTNFSTRNFDPVPLNNNELGKVTIANIFPTAELIQAEGEIPEEGLLIPFSITNTYGGDLPVNTTTDARDWIYAVFLAMVAESTLRTTSVESAITNRSNLLTQRVAGLLIPANYYGSEPITGLLAADLPHSRIFTDTLLIEYEVETNPQTQTVEVKVAYTL